MSLRQLVSPSRYRRCRAIFRRPLAAQIALAAGWSWGREWRLKSGDRIRVPRVRSMRPLFDWLLESAPDPLPVAAEAGCFIFRHGPSHVCLRPAAEDFEVFQEVFLRDTYRVGQLRPSLGTVLDLGAHVGLFALRVAALAERVICVEPAAANAAVLEQTVRRNALGDKVRLHRGAITAGTTPRVSLFLAGRDYGHSLQASYAARWGAPTHEEVPAWGLAELFEREQIDRCGLLKCDIEGAEYAVFEAAPRDLLERIDRLILEVHLLRPRWEEPRLARLMAKLRDAGLTVAFGSPRRPAKGEDAPDAARDSLEPLYEQLSRDRPWALLFAQRT